MYRLLIYADETSDIKTWRPWLESIFEVTQIANPESLLNTLQVWKPHLVLFTGKIINHLFIQKVLSTYTSKIGVIFIAPFYDIKQEQLAFTSGADHFLLASTPVESAKIRLLSLAQKIEKLSKTQNEYSPLGVLPNISAVIKLRNIQIYPEQKILKINGQIAQLTPTQFKLLLALINHPDQLLTRQWLIKNVFDGVNISPRSVDAQVAKLKKRVPALKSMIMNIYGSGYIFSKRQADDAA